MRRSMVRWRVAAVGLAAVLLLGLPLKAAPEAKPAEKGINMSALVSETQKMSRDNNKISLVWWIPQEFWKASLSETAGVTKDQAEEFLKVFRPYMIVAVVEGSMGPFAGAKFSPEAQVRARLVLRDKEGNAYSPIADDKVEADLKNVLAAMKPILSNMLGPLGQNIHFFVFPAQNKAGQTIADPQKEGSLLIKLGDEEYKWRLPLGSLLPAKTCTSCREELNGAYKFCPWCGTKLPETKLPVATTRPAK